MSDGAQGKPLLPPTASLRILGQEKAFILVFVCSAVLTSLALTYVASEKYEATTTIFYRPQSVWSTRPSKTESFGSPMPTPPFKVIGRTLQEVARSNVILGPVVLELNLHVEPPKSYEGLAWYVKFYKQTKDFVMEYGRKAWKLMKYGRLPEVDPFQEAVMGVRKSIRIVNEDSYIFALVVRDKYPKRAERIVAAIANGLVDWLHEQERSPGESRRTQLGQLLEARSEEIEDHRNIIEQLLVDNEIASVDDERQRALERWSQLELERVKLESQIVQIRAQVGGIQEKLAQEHLPASFSTSLRAEDYHELRATETAAQIELAGFEASYKSVEQAASDLRRHLQELPAIATSRYQLEFKVEKAERDVLGLQDAYQEATVRATGQQSEAHVLHAPVAPMAPVAPIKIYHVGLTLFLSLSTAIGLVYLLAFLNVRVLFSSIGPKGRRTPQPESPDEPQHESVS